MYRSTEYARQNMRCTISWFVHGILGAIQSQYNVPIKRCSLFTRCNAGRCIRFVCNRLKRSYRQTFSNLGWSVNTRFLFPFKSILQRNEYKSYAYRRPIDYHRTGNFSIIDFCFLHRSLLPTFYPGVKSVSSPFHRSLWIGLHASNALGTLIRQRTSPVCLTSRVLFQFRVYSRVFLMEYSALDERRLGHLAVARHTDVHTSDATSQSCQKNRNLSKGSLQKGLATERRKPGCLLPRGLCSTAQHLPENRRTDGAVEKPTGLNDLRKLTNFYRTDYVAARVNETFSTARYAPRKISEYDRGTWRNENAIETNSYATDLMSDIQIKYRTDRVSCRTTDSGKKLSESTRRASRVSRNIEIFAANVGTIE